MAYKTASQKILVWLFIIAFTITAISGDYWRMWSILPTTFFMLWLAGKSHILRWDSIFSHFKRVSKLMRNIIITH